MSRSLLALIVTALSLALSGCSSSQAGTSSGLSSSAAPSAPPPEVTVDTGSIQGQVVDDELRVLPGADVSLKEAADRTAKSDVEGKFTFNDLPPASYTVFVQKLGYDSQARRADVLAGEVAAVKFTLKPIPINEARQEAWIDNGYIHLSVWTWVVGVNPTVGLDDVRSFRHNVTPGLVALVSSMTWDSSAPGTARYLFVRDAIAGGADNRTQGRSPVVNRILDLDLKKNGNLTVSWGLSFPCPTLSTGCVDIWTNNPLSAYQVAFEQRVRIYTSAFYGEPPAADFTGLPP